MSTRNDKSGAARRFSKTVWAVALLVVTVVVGASCWRGSHAQGQPAAEARTTLRPEGFDPAKVTCAAGHLKLTVVNESGEGGLTLRMKRMGGDVVREDQVSVGSSEWAGEYDLAAGDYVLSVVENPAMLYYVTAQ